MRSIDFTDSVNATIQGDMNAFEFLYNQTYYHLRLTIAKYLKKEADIEDVLQNTYLKIYSELPNLKEPKTFWKWAGTIATNAALTEIRRQKALKNSMVNLIPPTKGSFEKEDKTSAIEALDEIPAETYYAEFNPEASMDVKETKRLIDEMLADLPNNQRECIFLWLEQYSTKEIAERLAMPIGTVKTNVSLAKKKIKANVLELEKKGTKLYGMAPIPFFLWVFKLFDTSYADTLPAQGDDTLYERITSYISAAASSAGEISQTDNLVAQNTDSRQTSKSTTPAESKSAAPNKSAANGNSAITETPLSSAATSTAAKTGATGVKVGIHSLSVKIIVAIVCVGVVGIGGIFGYQTLKKQRIQEVMNSLPTTSEGLAEHLKLNYIGNQLYIAEDNLSVPIGCIEAYAYDLDADNQKEVLTIENTEDDFNFVPTLNIYEYDSEWTVAASTPLKFSEKNWGWDKDNMSGRYGKLFIHDNGVVLADNYATAEDDVSFINNGEHTLFSYDDEKLTETPVDYDFYDLYENGLELCSIETQYINNNIYDSFALTHMDINSYYNESYYNHGNWTNEQESYLVNFVDYTNLNTYDYSDYSFQYPAYFDSYISYGENVMEYDITAGTEICMTGRGTSILFGFSNSKYQTAQDITSCKSGGIVHGLYQDVYGMYKLVWENDSDFIYYENAAQANTRKMLEQTVLNEKTLKDINTLNVNLLLLSDSNNVVPYHFHTDMEGITYPTKEVSDNNNENQMDKTAVDWDKYNKNDYGITLDDLLSAPQAPFDTDLRDMGIVLIAEDTKNDIALYQYSKRNAEDEEYDYDQFGILRMGNLFRLMNGLSNLYIGDILYESPVLFYEDFDLDGENEIMCLVSEKSGSYFIHDGDPNSIRYSYVSWSYDDTSQDLGKGDDNLVYNSSFMEIIEGNGFLKRPNNTWGSVSYDLLNLNTDFFHYQPKTEDIYPEVLNGIFGFSMNGQKFEIDYTPAESIINAAKREHYIGRQVTWSYEYSQLYEGMKLKYENGRIILTYPFALTDYIGHLYDNERIAYIGRATVELKYNGGYTDEFWDIGEITIEEIQR